MSRYWLIGDAPSILELEKPELWWRPDSSGLPSPANRLLDITGWTISTFLATFNPRTNLWANPHRVWVNEGRAQAARMAEQSLKDGSDGVIVLGSLAARMFDLQAEEAMEWRGRFAFVPHPALQSKQWSPERREQGRAFFASLLHTPRARRKTGG
ncbi:MAG: hypothetical protein ABL998_00900 [Planctomycetota bacterium]